MTDPLAKVTPGQKLKMSAATYNTFVDAARAFRNSANDQSRNPRPDSRQNSVVLVRNDSGSARDQFEILGISGVLISPSDGEEVFKNSQPSLIGVIPNSSHKGKFVVLVEPVAAGELGRAVIDGLAIVRINMNNASEKFAEVSPGNCSVLKSVISGTARILWTQSSVNLTWALVRLGDVPEALVPDDDDFQYMVWINKIPQFQKPEECEETNVAKTDAENDFSKPQNFANASASSSVTLSGSAGAVVIKPGSPAIIIKDDAGNVRMTINELGQMFFANLGGSSVISLGSDADRSALRNELKLGSAAPLDVATSVGNPGDDNHVPTEKAVRAALAGAGGSITVQRAGGYSVSPCNIIDLDPNSGLDIEWEGGTSGLLTFGKKRVVQMQTPQWPYYYQHRNLASWTIGGGNNGIKLKTNLSISGQHKVCIHVHGFANYGADTVELICIPCWSDGSTFDSAVVTSKGSYQPNVVFAFENGKLVIWFEIPTGGYAWFVDADGIPTPAEAQGWEFADEAIAGAPTPGAYTNELFVVKRLLPSVVGNYVEIGSFNNIAWDHSLQINITTFQGYGATKLYYLQTVWHLGTDWYRIQPAMERLDKNLVDFDLECKQDATGGGAPLYLRLVRKVGTDQTRVIVRIYNAGNQEAVVWTQGTGTAQAGSDYVQYWKLPYGT